MPTRFQMTVSKPMTCPTIEKGIKINCIQEDGDRCRFLVVDAYNEAQVLRYYEKNDFKFLFSSEDQEKEYHQMDGSQILRTRFMYFDLLALR